MNLLSVLLFQLTLVKAFVNPSIFRNSLKKIIDPIHKNNINEQLYYKRRLYS